MLKMQDMDENKSVEEKSTDDSKIESVINKRFICILVTLAVAFLSAIACFISLFVKVNEVAVNRMILSSLRDETRQNMFLIDSFNEQSLAVPLSSCAALSPSSPSGNYWVRNSIGSAVLVYCDMTTSCGNVTGGWMRVAQVNMTDSSQFCPSGLRERTYIDSIRTCVRNLNQRGCSTVILPTSNTNYSRVCGRITAYQYGNTNGFNSNAEEYVDGVGLFTRYSGEHIWSFAAGLSQIVSTDVDGFHYCPCTDNSTGNEPKSFVGDDYFCDSGQQRHMAGQPPQLFSDDPLWDGAGCGSENTCCDFNTPPWFYKELLLSTAEDIWMRVCRDENDDEDIAIQEFEVYVQ